MTISLVCHHCKRINNVPGTPLSYACVYEAARARDWAVEGRRVRCPSCRELALRVPDDARALGKPASATHTSGAEA